MKAERRPESRREAGREPVAAARPVVGREEVADRVVGRWPLARRFVEVGFAYVAAGGAVAACTRPTGFELGPWVAAYLVLVGGVAQLVLGAGQVVLPVEPPTAARVRMELLVWNAGVVTTIVGTVLATPMVTTVGSLAVGGCSVSFFGARRVSAEPWPRWRLAHRAVASVVAASAGIGLLLAWARH